MAEFMPPVRKDFPRKIRVIEDQEIFMPDGCRLSARLWLPVDALEDPVPVILEHLPYRKRDGTIVRDEISHPWMAGHGYACLRVDMRGNGDSDGLMEDEYTAQELQDACDVIAWAAAQPWCNGKAGMMGISWGGFNSLQVAALRPPALKAIITLCSTVDRFGDDIHYKGGAMLGENFGWAATMLAYSSRPPDPALLGERYREVWLERLEHLPFLAGPWMRHQRRDAYWKHGSVCEDYSAIEAAVLSIGGWHDGYRNTISHLAGNLSAPVKGIVGPWIHKYPHYAGPEPRIGFLQEARRWWDRWLKDIDTGVEEDPAYRVWLMDSLAPRRWWDERPGRWIAEREWPSDGIAQTTLHLGEGVLREAAQGIHASICSPADCGLAGGEYFPFSYAEEFPGDQTPDDERSACFDGEPLETAIDIVGAPAVTLHAACDRRMGQVAVRLCDLRPDGTSALITMGVLNLAHRHSFEEPSLLRPGETFETRIVLDQIAYRVPAGHRLRIAISTAYWPFLWPAPEPATLTLSAGYLDLPLRKHLAQADEWEFEPAEGSAHWRHEVLRPGRYERRIEKEGQVIRLHIHQDAGENRDLDHGLISGSQVHEVWSIDPADPLSAHVTARLEKTGGRDGWRYRTLSHMEMRADAGTLHVTGSLEVSENGGVIFRREYDEKIEREFI